MKILSIEEKAPKATTLPDGIYFGTWGGSVIEVHYDKKIYQLTTEGGVRGFGFRVVVTIKDGIATFEGLKN